MATLTIQGTEVPYDEKDILTFSEGLLGLPQLRRMVLVKQSSIEPFMWLASLDHEGVAFVVVEAQALFPDYSPTLPSDSALNKVLAPGEKPLVLTIVLIDSDWWKSTANLRAPVYLLAHSMQGAQLVLSEDRYQVGAPLPKAVPSQAA